MATESDEASPQGPDEERAPPLYLDKRTARFANGERVICFEWPEYSPRPFNIEIVDYH